MASVAEALLSWSVQCRYGAEQGKGPLREAICERLYKGMGIKPSDIFVSDGSKCDIGRLQVKICQILPGFVVAPQAMPPPTSTPLSLFAWFHPICTVLFDTNASLLMQLKGILQSVSALLLCSAVMIYCIGHPQVPLGTFRTPTQSSKLQEAASLAVCML